MSDKKVNLLITAKDEAGSVFQKFAGVAKTAAGAIAGAFALDRLGNLGEDLGKIADQYANLKSQVELANASGKGLNLTLADTAKVATDTFSGLESTTQLVGAIARAGQELGLSQQQVLSLSQTINQANQLGGQGAEAADAAVRQLIQGLQSGVLRGDEFNSVMEQSPRLARAMADGLGVTIGQLRQLAQDGKLTADVVVGALEGQADAINGEFAKIPETIGRAMTNLNTQWTQFIGELDQSTGASKTAAQALNGVAANLDTIASLATVAGEATLAAFAGKAVPAVLSYGRQMIATVGELRAAQAAQNATLAQTHVRYDQFRLDARSAANEVAYLTARQREGGATAEIYATQVAAASARLQAANAGIVTSRDELAKLSGQSSVAAGKIRGLFAAIPGPLKLALTVIGFEALAPAGKALGELIAKMGEAGEIEQRVAEQSRKSAQDRISSGQRLIEMNRQYRDVALLTAAEVAKLSEADRTAYEQRLEGAKNYQLGVLRTAAAEKELGLASEYSGEQA